MTGEKLDICKLTDAQLAVLSRAARRRDGALTRPDNLKGKARAGRRILIRCSTS